VVFHNAAAVGDWGAAARFTAVNVEGTRALVEACRQAGAPRIVHTSSLTVLGIPTGGARVDEESPYTTRPPIPYVASKIGAEQVLRAAGAQVPFTIVRPAAIWGPGDKVFFARWERLARRGRLFDIGRGDNHVGMTHIDNLVHGLVLAAETERAAGQIYHITDGVDPTTGELFRALAAATGYAPPRFSVPVGLLKVMAAVAQASSNALGRQRPPLLTPYAVALLSCDGRYDIAKARRELGYEPPLDLGAALADLTEWFRTSSSDR
jgi:nucleoside-diphosphate-sugar epimerase